MYRTGKNYYPQVFLEECEYAAKEKVCMSMLLVTQIFLLLKKILIIHVKKILMKNTLMKKVNLNKC